MSARLTRRAVGWKTACACALAAACGPGGQQVGGFMHAEFSAFAGANTRGDTFDAKTFQGSVFKSPALATFSGQDAPDGMPGRRFKLSVPAAPVSGQSCPLGALKYPTGPADAVAQLDFTDDRELDGIKDERSWTSTAGTVTIVAAEGRTASYSVSGASMVKASATDRVTTGTFKVDVSGRVDQMEEL